MSDGGTATLEGLLRDHFGVQDFPDDAPPLVPLASHRGVAVALKERGYLVYGFVAASHWPATPAKKGAEAGDPEHFEVATALRTIGPRSHLAIWRVRVLPGEAIDSLVDLFPGADWQEREQFDLVGVGFAHHPDLRRLMMPDDWEGHPLRRDYAIDTHCLPWR